MEGGWEGEEGRRGRGKVEVVMGEESKGPKGARGGG